MADVCEWYDDVQGCFCIDVRVSNATWGPLFGYRGTFQAAWLPVRPGSVPCDARPRREEARV